MNEMISKGCNKDEMAYPSNMRPRVPRGRMIMGRQLGWGRAKLVWRKEVLRRSEPERRSFMCLC